MEYLRIRLQKIDVATLVDFHYIEKILCLHLKSKNFVQALQNNIYFKVLVRILLKCMQLCMYCKVGVTCLAMTLQDYEASTFSFSKFKTF